MRGALQFAVCLHLILLCLAGGAAAQRTKGTKLDPRIAAQVDEVIRAKIDETGAVGLAVGIIQDRRVALVETYGLANRETNKPVTRNTMFRWASCSKPVTALAAMQLVDQGRLNLDDDIRKYVPEFPQHDATITVRQLLCHQGGIVHYSNGKVIPTLVDYEKAHPFADVVVALDRFKASPLVAVPGTKYSYSTYGYILLSAVVQRAGNEPFAEQVSKRIAGPAKLKSLQPDYQWINIPHRAEGYRKKDDMIVPSVDEDVSWKLGGGGFISNIDDFAGFAATLLQGNLLSPTAYEAMWTRQHTTDGKETEYGLGFNITPQRAGLRVSHNGSQEKTRTRLVIYPEKGSGVVLMTNSEWVEPEDFTTAIFKALK